MSEASLDPSSKAYIPEGKALPGAVMGIYAEEDVMSATGETLISKGELIEVIVSDEKGHCQSREDYPITGNFYVQEIVSPEGYVRSAETYPLSTDSDETSENLPLRTVTLSEPVQNEKARAYLEIRKTASDTSAPMKDVEFEIYTAEGAHLVSIRGRTDPERSQDGSGLCPFPGYPGFYLP